MAAAPRKPYRRCTKTDPQFGPICRCGQPKAKQAFTCQACHNLVRGYGTVPLAEQNRRWRHTYLGIVGAVGDEDAGLIHRADALAEARAAADGELAALIAEQARDDRAVRVGSRWMVSLDSTDRFGRPLAEVIAA